MAGRTRADTPRLVRWTQPQTNLSGVDAGRRRRTEFTGIAGEIARMFRAERASPHRRGQAAGKTVALRARRKTFGGDIQLAGLQDEHLSEAQVHAAEKVSWNGMVIDWGLDLMP